MALKALIRSLAEDAGDEQQGAGGVLSEDMWTTFERMDRDADGRVTYAEVRAGVGRWMAGRECCA